MNELALLLRDEEKLTEAEPLFAELYRWALAGLIALLADQVARILSGEGPCLAKLARYPEAEQP
jgi:hypothetical protein